MLGVGAINVLFVPFLITDLGASPAWAGALELAQTVSMILAGALMAVLAARFSVPRLFVGGLVGLAVCVGLLSVAPGPWALLLIMFAVGWFVMPVQATTMTIVQKATTNETRGRVAGALNAAIQTASIASMAVAGLLADVTGIRVVFALGGAVALLRRGRRLVAVPQRARDRARERSRHRLTVAGIETAPASGRRRSRCSAMSAGVSRCASCPRSSAASRPPSGSSDGPRTDPSARWRPDVRFEVKLNLNLSVLRRVGPEQRRHRHGLRAREQALEHVRDVGDAARRTRPGRPPGGSRPRSCRRA